MAVDEQGRVPRFGLNTRAQLFERRDDPAHRACAQGYVAREHRDEILSGEHARQHTHRRTAVAAIERFCRRAKIVCPNAFDNDITIAFAFNGNSKLAQTVERGSAIFARRKICDSDTPARQR